MSKAVVITPQLHHSWVVLQDSHERLLRTKQREAHRHRRSLTHGLATLRSTGMLHLCLLGNLQHANCPMTGRSTSKLPLGSTTSRPACMAETRSSGLPESGMGLSFYMLDSERHKAVVVVRAAQNTLCRLADLNLLGACQHAARLNLLQECCIHPLRTRAHFILSGTHAPIPEEAHHLCAGLSDRAKLILSAPQSASGYIYKAKRRPLHSGISTLCIGLNSDPSHARHGKGAPSELPWCHRTDS